MDCKMFAKVYKVAGTHTCYSINGLYKKTRCLNDLNTKNGKS